MWSSLELKRDNDYRDNYFKITLFSIDSYITKPDLIYDETYSSYRKCNINLATIVRIFGTTDDGIKTCIHIHQHFPHFSIREKDIAASYGIVLDSEPDFSSIDVAVLECFIDDVEKELAKYIQSGSKNQSNEILIIDVQKYSAKSFYGYHEKPEFFYKFYFSSFWMANQAKNLLEKGLINKYPIICYDFFEFLQQFYIDNHIYLNTIYLKKITVRKSKNANVYEDLDDVFDLNFDKKRKLNSIEALYRYNNLPTTTSCLLECDAFASDIFLLEHKKNFPENNIFNPTIPGIIKLWNDQFQRTKNNFENILNALRKDSTKNNEPKNNERIIQLDGTADDFLLCKFGNKRIKLDSDQSKCGYIYIKKSFENDTNSSELPLIVGSKLMAVEQISKKELIEPIKLKTKQFQRSLVYLNSVANEIKTKFKLNHPLINSDNVILKKNESEESSNALKLYFINNNIPKLLFHSTPKVEKSNLNLTKNLIQKSTWNRLFNNNIKNISTTLFNSFDSNNSILENINETFDELNGIFNWSPYSSLTLMSLELHARIRENFLPDPNLDPIQMVIFSIYNEYLNDDNLALKDNCLYFGAIIVRKNALNTDHMMINNKKLNIFYVNGEIELFTKLSQFVSKFDPDIMLGYIIDTFSWGYLLQRAAKLGIHYGEFYSRIINRYQSKNNFPGTLNKSPNLIGRIVLNVWKILRHEVTLRSYSFENVYFNVFGHRIPKYSNYFLNILWEKFLSKNNDLCQYYLIEYYFIRSSGTIKLLKHFDFIRRTFNLSCLFGMPFQDVIDRGTQFRVESMLFPICRDENLIPVRFPSTFIRKQKAPRAVPLILEPELTFHSEPVAVLDFQSLYPSIVIAYNYCYSTCIGSLQNIVNDDDTFGCYKMELNMDLLNNLEGNVHISPNDVVFVKKNIRQGIMPKMLEELLNTRILIKKELKDVDRKLLEKDLSKQYRRKLNALKRHLDICQLGLKMIANVTYGYTNANFSGRMPCVEIADSIVSQGRRTLEEAIQFVNEWGYKSGTNANVIYGDTDSIFISFPGATLENAFEMANFILEEINQRQPYPVCLKLEKIYQPCVIMAKKRYCGYAFDGPTMKSRFESKGIETIRRDTCNITAKIMEKCIKLLFENNGNVSSLKSFVQWQFRKILLNRLSQLNDFIFAKEYFPEKYYCNSSIVPACIVGRKRTEIDPRDQPKLKERIPYVIVQGEPNQRLADLVRQPFELLNDNSLKLNGTYYITKAIIPALARLLDSLVDDGNVLLQAWYNEVKIASHRPSIELNNERKETSKKLNAIQLNNIQTLKEKLTDKELSQEQLTVMFNSFWIVGQKLKQFENICTRCCQIDIKTLANLANRQQHECLVVNCPNLYRYYQAEEDFERLTYINDLLSSKCRVNQ